MKQNRYPITLFILLALFLIAASPQPSPNLQTDISTPPEEVVKLIFIHHSTGRNWLIDDYGNLGRTLGENNYFVSDTNYEWGPNAIGDRTDIPNWTEWFASADTPIYMEALFNETGQNSSSYTRTLSDPGGENEIIVFKSCFPNSELKGNPNDPPGTSEELSVGGAKYVYNTILQYFASRPDKLFVVVTAPPMSGVKGWWYAENARAFNQWLVNDWLRENNYTLNNVAVFDFYNILTDPDAHHRVNNGQIEHMIGQSNTLYYPTSDGDDHPSVDGSRKATEEFVPMLNVFYHRWKGSTTALQTTPEPVSTTQVESQPEAGFIDNFEFGTPFESYGWEAYHDEATTTSMACSAEAGTGLSGNSLKLDFDIAANSWGTCALFYENPQDWSAGKGLTFYYRAAQEGTYFDINIYAETGDDRETYLYTIQTSADSVNNWTPMELRWEDFHRAAWEENGNEPFTKTNEITGMSFGLGTFPDTPNTSTILVDDISVFGIPAPTATPEPTATFVPEQQPTTQPEETKGPSLPCAGAMVLPFAIALLPLWKKMKK